MLNQSDFNFSHYPPHLLLYNYYNTTPICIVLSKKKSNQIVKYLFNELDHDSIISKEGMHNFLIRNGEDRYVTDPQPGMGRYGTHPNQLGHSFYVKNKLIPRLNELGFFND